METYVEKLAQEITNFRLARSETQDQFARETGVSLAFYQSIEQGRRKPPLDLLYKLSKLGFSVDAAFRSESSGPRFNRFKNLRKELGLKQKDIASVLGIDQRVYSNYETGKREIPTRLLVKLADYYQTSTDFLLGRTSVSRPYN